MDQEEVFSSGTKKAGNRRPTSMGTPRSVDVPLPSRVSPARRDGYAASSSPLVEHTRRVAMEAQAYRTQARQQDLEGSMGDDEEILPAGEAEHRILRSFAQESPIYPGTEARQNVTVRRSRDRLSAGRTPDAVTSRRSSLRNRDRRYSLESSTLFRDHESQYLDGLQLLEEPGYEFVERISEMGNERVTRPLLESRKTASPETRAFAEACIAVEASVAQANAVDSSSVEQRHSPLMHLDEEGSDSDDGKPLPLFTRHDIPDATEDLDTHELLLGLWERRKDASEQLVQAMEEDDIEAFEELEQQVRNYNRLMVKTKAHYEKQKSMKRADDRYLQKSATKFVGVDDLSFGPKTPSGARSNPNHGTDEFRILLTYQGNQVFRKAHPRTPNRVIHYVAQQYLRDVFAVRVGDLSQLLLLHKGEILSQQGKLEDVPVEDGDEIMVINLLQEEQEEKDQPRSHLRSGKRPSDHQDSEFVNEDADANTRGAGTPGRSGNNREDYNTHGNHAGQRWEGSQPVYPGGGLRNHRGELHPLKGARASSRPGTNGEANLCESPQGFQRGESHSLTNARAPSQPGTNGGAFTLQKEGDSPRALVFDNRRSSPTHDPGSRAHDKIRQVFKCPRFSGQPKDWKT